MTSYLKQGVQNVAQFCHKLNDPNATFHGAEVYEYLAKKDLCKPDWRAGLVSDKQLTVAAMDKISEKTGLPVSTVKSILDASKEYFVPTDPQYKLHLDSRVGGKKKKTIKLLKKRRSKSRRGKSFRHR